MGRKANVRWYESKQAFMCTYQGQRHNLGKATHDDSPNGPLYLAALAKFTQLMTTGEPDEKDDRVIAIIERWSDHIEKFKSKGYFEDAKNKLDGAVKAFGALKVSQLRIHHVEDWLQGENWNSTSKTMGWAKLLTSLNWNVEQGYLTTHPLKDKKSPDCCVSLSRGEECVLSDDFIKVIFANCTGRFREILTVLHRTGARPSEITEAEDFHYRPQIHALFYDGNATRGYIHKNARKKKSGDNHRTIFLPPDVEELVARNKREVRKGFLFRSRESPRYTQNALRLALKKLKERKPVVEYMRRHHIEPNSWMLYSFRHTWITNALKKGTSIKLVADWCGTSVRTIEKHYAHATADPAAMYQMFLLANPS